MSMANGLGGVPSSSPWDFPEAGASGFAFGNPDEIHSSPNSQNWAVAGWPVFSTIRLGSFKPLLDFSASLLHDPSPAPVGAPSPARGEGIQLLDREEERLEGQLRHEKDPAKLSGLQENLHRIREGQAALTEFDKEVRVDSLSHTELRQNVRSRLVRYYLQPDLTSFEELQKEIEVLKQVQKVEELQGYLFDELTRVVPVNSLFFGQSEVSEDYEAHLNDRAAELWRKEFGKPGPFEVRRKDVEKTLFYQELKKLEESDPERAKGIKRGLWWLMHGDTFRAQVFLLRSPVPRLSRELENLFRFPLDPGQSFPALEEMLAYGTADLAVLKSFLDEVAQEERIREAGQDPISRLQFVIDVEDRRMFLETAAASGLDVDLGLVKEDLKRDVEILRNIYRHRLEAQKQRFLAKQSMRDRLHLESIDGWEKHLGQFDALPPLLRVLTPAYDFDFKKTLWSFLPTQTIGDSPFPSLRPSLELRKDPDLALVETYRDRLAEFEIQASALLEQSGSATNLQEILEAGKGLQLRLRENFEGGIQDFLEQTRLVALRGGEKLKTADQEKLRGFQSEAETLLKIQDPVERNQRTLRWMAEIQIFVLGINIEEEIALMKELQTADYHWGVIRGGFRELIPGVASKDYNASTLRNYQVNYLHHLHQAQRLYQKGNYHEAMNIFLALQNSPQRQYNLEKGKSSARWSGLTIGIGIVAASVLTAGTLTEILLPVGVEGMSLLLAAGRFTVMATTFWATDRFLDSKIYGHSFWGSSATTGGKINDVLWSYLENLLMFGAFSGAGKLYQGFVRSALVPHAERLAIQSGAGNFLKLPKHLQDEFILKALQGLGKSGRFAIGAGGHVNSWFSLNLWSALSQPGYDAFSWETQQDLVLFLSAMSLFHPLSERIHQAVGLRKIRVAEAILKEVDVLDGECLKWGERYQRYLDLKTRVKDDQKFFQETPIETLTQHYRDLMGRRLTLMKQLPKIFEEGFIKEVEREYLKTEWSLVVQSGREKWDALELRDSEGNPQYRPTQGKKFLAMLPALLGEGAAVKPKIFIQVQDNGVIEIQLSVTIDGKTQSFAPEFIHPTRPPTRGQIQAMRRAILKQNQMVETKADPGMAPAVVIDAKSYSLPKAPSGEAPGDRP